MSTVKSNSPAKLKSNQLYLIGAVVLTVITVLYFNSVLQSARKSQAEADKVTTTPVMVATHNIAPGSVITAGDVKAVNWPSNAMPADAVFNDAGKLVGRVAKAEILVNEPVYNTKLANKNSAGGLTVMIPKGLRAVTIAVSEVKGVGGFVKPGDRVDVLATFDQGNSGDIQKQLTKTVLQNATVLAAAQQTASQDVRTKEDTEKPVLGAPAQPSKKESTEARIVSSVTLALTPADAEKLALADEAATIRLVLRGEEDDDTVTLAGISNQELMSGRNYAPTRVATKGVRASVSVRRSSGGGSAVEFFDSGEKSVFKF